VGVRPQECTAPYFLLLHLDVWMAVLYTPDCVRQDEETPIFSLDCHPDGTTLATTSGQRVYLWALSPVSSHTLASDSDVQRKLETVSDDADRGIARFSRLGPVRSHEVGGHPEVRRKLATLVLHHNAVNCVRFSKSGRWLASGSTDTVIFLYEKRAPGPVRAAVGGSDIPDGEWENCQALRGHMSDVVDLAWAPDDSMLASCSLDCTLIVWNPITGKRVRALKGHTSFVKGVAWDPIGQFLVTQSDDKSCIVWRIDDWSIVSEVTVPFTASFAGTFTLRPCWLPDGAGVVACNSRKEIGSCFAAQLLERGTWVSTFNFVGHKGPVVTVCSSPVMFRRAGEAATVAMPYAVIACGSQDNRITVWATNRPNPVCVIKAFTESVSDMCWSTDGYTLFACSVDGTVVTCTFDEEELGTSISNLEKQELLSEMYGCLLPETLAPVANAQQLQQKHQGNSASTGTVGVSKGVAGGRAAAGAGRDSGGNAGGDDSVEAGGERAPKVPRRIAPQPIGHGGDIDTSATVGTGLATRGGAIQAPRRITPQAMGHGADAVASAAAGTTATAAASATTAAAVAPNSWDRKAIKETLPVNRRHRANKMMVRFL